MRLEVVVSKNNSKGEHKSNMFDNHICKIYKTGNGIKSHVFN